MTAKELAKELSLSPATVSMALNGRPGVSEKTRQRVLEAAAHYGMQRADPAAQSRKIGVILYQENLISNLNDSFLEPMLGGIDDAAKKHGMTVLFARAGSIPELYDVLVKTGAGPDTAGILLAGNQLTQEVIDHFPKPGKPLVLIDNTDSSMTYSCVQIANRAGTFEAVNFLIRRLHSVPGYIMGKHRLTNFVQRFMGYRDALAYNHVGLPQQRVFEVEAAVDGACRDMAEILAEQTDRNLVSGCYMCDNDEIAIGCMKAFTQAGYGIPEDVQICGFDDIRAARYVSPELTTVHVPTRQIGYMSVQRLLDVINGSVSFPAILEVGTRLVPGGTALPKDPGTVQGSRQHR